MSAHHHHRHGRHETTGAGAPARPPAGGNKPVGAAPADSVPLDTSEPFEGEHKQQQPPPEKSNAGKFVAMQRYASLKILISLFVIFIVIVSDMFVNNVLSGFGEKAVRGRSPTAWGVVLQGIFLVIFYILALALVEHKVL